MPPREGIYGLLPEFNTPTELVIATEQALPPGLSPHGVLHALSRSKRPPRRCTSTRPVCRSSACSAASWGSPLRSSCRPGSTSGGTSIEHRRPPLVLLACLHHSRLRVDDSFRRSFRRLRHDRAERSAAALSPALQCAELPLGRDHGQVFPLPRGVRPAVLARRAPGRFSNSSPRSLSWRWTINRSASRSTPIQRTPCPAAAAALGLSLVALAGCRQDMHNQPKFYPQRGSDFYADGRSVRPQVENTVARSQLHQDSYFYTGIQDGKEGDGMPFPVTETVLARGQTSATTSSAHRATRASATAPA